MKTAADGHVIAVQSVRVRPDFRNSNEVNIETGAFCADSGQMGNHIKSVVGAEHLGLMSSARHTRCVDVSVLNTIIKHRTLSSSPLGIRLQASLAVGKACIFHGFDLQQVSVVCSSFRAALPCAH